MKESLAMLTVSDSLSRSRPLGRRSFMQIGGLSLGSIALPLLRGSMASAAAPSPVTGKSVISCFSKAGPRNMKRSTRK